MHDSEQQAISYRPVSHTHRLSPLPRYALQAMIVLLSLTTNSFAVLHAAQPRQQPKALLDQIWPYQMPHRQPLSKEDQVFAEAALIQWLEAYLHREYKVIDARFFWDDRKNSMWGPIIKGHALYIEGQNRQWHGVKIEQPWHSPGFDLAIVWRVDIDGNDHYVAIAMTKEPVPGTRGRRLAGRFELENQRNRVFMLP